MQETEHLSTVGAEKRYHATEVSEIGDKEIAEGVPGQARVAAGKGTLIGIAIGEGLVGVDLIGGST
jgi:hypothetical protein